MKEINRLLSWLNKNSDKFFVVAGKLTMVVAFIALVLWLIRLGLTALSNVRGFQFDPFMLVAVSFLGIMFFAQARQMNSQISEIKELQQQIIAKERSLVVAEPKTKSAKKSK
jgi:membrane protein implicated in regulation of membrane protease activity